MPSFFESLKKTIGLKGNGENANSTSKQGNILGTGSNNSNNSNGNSNNKNHNNSTKPTNRQAIGEHGNYEIIERIFLEDRMGMSIQEYRERLPFDPSNQVITRPYVQSVNVNSEAQRNEIQPLDIILTVNEIELNAFEDFYSFIATMGRPVTIKFYRLKKTNSTIFNGGGGGMTSMFKGFGGSSTANTGNSNQPALSEEEKRQRREMLSKAAKERTQQWDKKVSTAKAKAAVTPTNRVENTFPNEVSNPETLRAVQKTKELEVKIEKDMGYSPFRPHMSFTGNEAAANAIKASNSGQQLSNSEIPGITNPSLLQAEPISDEEIELMIAEVDDAFAMLLSLGESEQEIAKVAVQTVHKMLQNLFANKQDPKFRSIRLNNKAFQSKVASVCGAVELLVAAGYCYEFSEVPVAPSGNSPTAAAAAPPLQAKNHRYSLEDEALFNTLGNTTTTPYFQRDGFLVHLMDRKAERKLEYTLSRLQELLDVQAQSP